MKMRDSGMPDEAYWETLLDPELVLDRLVLAEPVASVAELGCGYGTFTVPLARRLPQGTVEAFDIDQRMVARTRERLAAEDLRSASCHPRDVGADGFGLAGGSQDAVLLFNILHCEQPVPLLAEAARVVRPGGRVLAIHWRSDVPTPRGPSLDIRPRPEHVAAWGAAAGLSADSPVVLPPWHFGIVLRRPPLPDGEDRIPHGLASAR